MTQRTTWAGSKPGHSGAVSAFHISTVPLFLIFSLPAATMPYSLQARANLQADWGLQGTRFTTNLSLTSRFFVLIQGILVLWLYAWSFLSCGDHVPARPRVCNLSSRSSASPIMWERPTERMEIRQDIPRNGWRLKGNLPNPEWH